jgi:hypothetical protein
MKLGSVTPDPKRMVTPIGPGTSQMRLAIFRRDGLKSCNGRPTGERLIVERTINTLEKRRLSPMLRNQKK